MSRRWGAVVALAVAVAGCARTLPRGTSESNLYRDLQRMVTIAQTAGWQIDRVEVDELLPDALMSVCRVRPEVRQALLGWLDTRIVELGGPVEEAYERRGRKLDKVDELLEFTRVRKVLAASMASAASDCPFYVRPRGVFRGRQISDDRWMVSFGGGGQGIISRTDGTSDINFGGAGRLMLGRNFGRSWALLGGMELGGSASFPKDADGDRGSLVFGFDLVFPAVVRLRRVNSYVEIEAGYLTHYTEVEGDGVSGMKVAVAFGGRATRKRWFFPGAVFGVSYERTFPNEMEGAVLHLVKLGFRVAIDVHL